MFLFTMSSHKIFVQNYFYDLPRDIQYHIKSFINPLPPPNYFYDLPKDIQSIIYNYTIPIPPIPPPITKKYSLDFKKLSYMDELVLNYPTSFLLRKRYNNIRLNFDYYFRNFIIKGVSIPFPDLYNLNKQIYDFCDDHSTYSFKKKFYPFKNKQTYINRFGNHY